jgi:DNA-binding NtrC family response regulator
MARILYLDDEEPLVFLLTRMMQLLGHEAAGFTSAIEALDAFREDASSFHLVLTDLSMPAMGGIEFATEILKLRPDTPVAVLTGHADARDVETARAAGVMQVTSKPGSIQQMEQTLNDLLAAARSR